MGNFQVSSIRLFSLLILLLTFCFVNRYNIYSTGGLWLQWIVQFLIIGYIIRYKNSLFPTSLNYRLLNIYLIWTIICIFRGLCIAENYWEYKNLISNGIALLIPIFLWVFCKPDVTHYVYRTWYRYAPIIFVIIFYWIVQRIPEFYLAPLLLLFCFFPLFNRKYAFLIFITALIYILYDAATERSQFIKGCVALLVGCATYYVHIIPQKLVRIGHIICYLCRV